MLDDYSPLREVSEELLRQEGVLFKPRKALQYTQIRGGSTSQGGDFFTADNPPYGAVFNYYLSKEVKGLAKTRKDKEKKINKEQDIPFPGWEALEAEKNQAKAKAVLVVSNATGKVVSRIDGPLKKGFQQVAWDLTQPIKTSLDPNEKERPNRRFRRAIPVPSGTYSVRLYKSVDGILTALGKAQEFTVEQIRKNILENPVAGQVSDYTKELLAFMTKMDKARHDFAKAEKKIGAFQKSLQYISADPGAIETKLSSLRSTMFVLKGALYGNASKAEVGEKDDPTVQSRLGVAQRGFFGNSYGPTKMHMESFEMAKQQYATMESRLRTFLQTDVPALEKMLLEAGAPPIIE